MCPFVTCSLGWGTAGMEDVAQWAHLVELFVILLHVFAQGFLRSCAAMVCSCRGYSCRFF